MKAAKKSKNVFCPAKMLSGYRHGTIGHEKIVVPYGLTGIVNPATGI
jgi:hypothetical protein